MPIGKYTAGFEGITPSNVTDMTGLASDSTKMNNIATNTEAMNALANSPVAKSKIGTSDTDSTGYQEIASSNMAIGKYAAGQAGLNAQNTSNMDNLANDILAMNTVSSSSPAMNAISNSSTAVNAVSGSSTAMSALASNAVSYIKSNWNNQSLSDGQSVSDVVVYAEVKGGGASMDDREDTAEDGENSSFGGLVAGGEVPQARQ